MIVLCRQCPRSLPQEGTLQWISLCLIALLVFATVTIVTILAFNPVILLNIAQLDTGQRDFILIPKGTYFNTTKIAQMAPLQPLPRVKTRVVIGNNKPAVGWFMDFQSQSAQGLGKLDSKFPFYNRSLFAHRSLGLREGQDVAIFLEDNSIFSLIVELVINKTISFNETERLAAEMKFLQTRRESLGGIFVVNTVFDRPLGKMGSAEADGCLFLDIRTAFRQMIQQTLGSNSALMQLVNSPLFRLGDLATEATINMPNRIAIYSNPDSEEVMNTIQAYWQKIEKRIGFFAINMEMPIRGKLQTLQYFGMLIGVMLKAIIVSLFLLSVLMLDSTLQMGVDKQKSNMAIMKVVGATRSHITIHILSGAVRQVLLANLIAYPLIYLVFYLIEETVQAYIGNMVELAFTLDACVVGFIIGLLVPIFASISPIINIIKNDLASSLGQGKPNYSDIKTEVYVEGQEFPWGKVAFGLVATVYGLSIYYLLPKAMINQNMGLLISLFFLFIQGLLVGLVVLSYSFQYILEEGMSKLLLFWVNSTDFALTKKNLSCHRMQNRRTSLIYALAVSFVMMIAVGFQLQIDATKDEFLQYMGGDIDIGGPYVHPGFINKLVAELPSIQSLTYMSQPLNEYLKQKNEVKNVMISDRAKLFFLEEQIYAIAGPFLPKEEKNGREVYYTQSEEPNTIYTHLDTEAGYGTCIISEYAARKMGLLQSDNHGFYINLYYSDRVKRVPIHYSSVISKRKGMYYTAYPFPNSQMSISADTFKMIAGIQYSEMPWIRAKLYIQDDSLLPNITATIKQRVRKNKQYSQNITFVWDRVETDQTFGEIERMLDAIMISLLVLLLVLCFFSLLTTTHANIRSQQKEIGVLLVLGYQKTNILKIHAYEAFVVVANSCCKGFAAGYMMAVVMAWQRQLFSSATVHLKFKAEYLAVIFVMAVASSLLATYRELSQTVNRKITDLLSAAN